MKAIIDEDEVRIIPTLDEVKGLCKIGHGADTCSWLLCGPNSWECSCLNKPKFILMRRKSGEMTAMRDGCDKVNNFRPEKYGIGTFEF